MGYAYIVRHPTLIPFAFAAFCVYLLVRADIADACLRKIRAKHAEFGSHIPYRPVYRANPWSIPYLWRVRLVVVTLLLGSVALAAYLS